MAACGLVFALAAQPIARLPLWWDEGGSVAYGSLPVAHLIQTIARDDVHPPGYYLLLHGWMQAAGASPFSIRLLSTLCAPLTAAVLFALGRRLLPRSSAALLAAVGVSLSGFALHHFSEARMYAPGMLLAASSFLIASLTGRRWSLWALLTVLIAGAYLHYGFIVIVLAHGLAGVADAVLTRRWRVIGVWAAMGLGFTLVYSPWLLATLGGTVSGDTRLGYATPADWLAALAIAATQIAAGPQAGLNGLVLPLVLIAIGGYAVWRLTSPQRVSDDPRESTPELPVGSDRTGASSLGGRPTLKPAQTTRVCIALALSALGGIVFASLFNYNPDGVGVAPRLGFAAVPGLVMLAALGLALLEGWRQTLTAGSLAVLMLSPALAVIGRQHASEEDFRPAATVLAQLAQPGDVALLTLHWQDGYIESYAPQAPLTLVRKLYSAETVAAFLADVRAQHQRIWIVNYRALYGDPGDPLYPLLNAQGALAYRQVLGNFELALVDFPQPATGERSIGFADVGALTAPTIARELQPGESLVLALRLVGVPAGRTLFAHLGLSATAPITQVDVPASTDLRLAVLVPAGTPPGAYQLYVGLYDPLTGQRDPLEVPFGCDEPERACLGVVQVK